MYLSFYKLKHKPFQISTDPRFLWLGEKHEEALATLKYGVLDNKGFLLLTGDVGTGKTTLINALLNSLDKNTFVASIRDPALDPLEFFQYTAHAFGMKASNINSKVSFLIQFEEFLLEAYTKKRKVLLIIDEAQRMSQELLEEVRLLSNIEKEESKLINIFFVGQIEFNEILLQHENRAIRQRVTINYNIETLTEQETRQYMKHRLDVASIEKVVSSFTPVQRMENGEYVRQGYTLPLPDTRKEIFTQKAIQEVHRFAKGYPRLINIICDRALLTGYVEGSRTVTDSHVRECIKELEIPHSQQKNKPAKVSESAAVANINIVKKRQNSPKIVKNDISPSKDISFQTTEQKTPATAEPSHHDKSTKELLSDLEKLVQKKERQPEFPEQESALNHGEVQEKAFQFGNYKNLIFFTVVVAFGVLLYISFSPTTLFNSKHQNIQRDTQAPSVSKEGQTSAELIRNNEVPAQMNQSAEETTQLYSIADQKNAPKRSSVKNINGSPEKTVSETSPSLDSDNNKGTENKQSSPEVSLEQTKGNTAASPTNAIVAANANTQEKDEISTKIEQLKELITFQKLVISFAPDSTLPQDESLRELDNLIEALRTHSSFKVTVTYYVNGKADNALPAKLIEYQAVAIKSYLMGKGLKAERINILKRDRQSISPFNDDTILENTNHSVEIYVDR
jgi:type II secretory pathway predicted ATPase ExeA/outer membrane protein OmpA-like peptidoglycan-associated protein